MADFSFEALFRGAALPMLVVDDAGIFIEANEALAELLGLPLAEVIGKDAALFVAPGLDPMEPLREYKEAGRSSGTYRFERADGRLVDFAYEASTIAPGRYLSILTDITEQRRVETALRRSEELFATAFLGAPLALSVSSMVTRKFTLVNQAFLAVTGYWRSEVIGRSAVDLNLWVDTELFIKVGVELRESGRSSAFQTAFRRKSGETVEGIGCVTLLDIAGEQCAVTAMLPAETAILYEPPTTP